MPAFKVDTGRLRSDAGDITGCVNQIKAKLSELTNDMAVLDSMWDGPASEAFKQVYNEDLNALSVMISNLKNIYTFETSAYERYDSCEQQVSGVISDIG